jgi:uncharacterized membrane protein required for colicin V production
MQIIDIIILVILGLGAIAGFKRGFFRQTVSSVGAILVIVFAFMLKNPVSIFMYEKLPFFNFDGVFAGVSSLNILLYEIIAFVVVASILFVILKVILGLTNIIEKILDFTILLDLPFKFLGAFMGIVEAYILIFMGLYVLTLPVFNWNFVNESKWKNRMLENTPVLSKLADDTVVVFNEIYALKDEFIGTTDSDKLNREVLDVLLKHKIVTVESVEKLYDTNKLQVEGLSSILNKYR